MTLAPSLNSLGCFPPDVKTRFTPHTINSRDALSKSGHRSNALWKIGIAFFNDSTIRRV